MRRRHQLSPRSEARWKNSVQRVRGGEILRDRVIAVIGRSGDRKPLLAANTRELGKQGQQEISSLIHCLFCLRMGRFSTAFLQLFLDACPQLQRRRLRADERLAAEREPKTRWNSVRNRQ